MSFMEPQIIWGRWYELRDLENDDVVWCDEKLDGYAVESEVEGWGARLSAPGYLDCTEWLVCDTEAEARDELVTLYDLCPHCLAQDDCGCDSGMAQMERSIRDHEGRKTRDLP